MKTCTGCVMALWSAAAAFGAAPKPVVEYGIAAQLDPAAKTIAGSEVLSWRNDSPDEVRQLQFHLYMNAFKNEKSTFMRESDGQSRGETARPDDWGWIDIKKMRLAGGADLTRTIRFLHPDDDNADDQTVAAVDLPEAVKPGGAIRLEIAFLTKLPHVFARAGYHGDFYLAGQWFPKIGVWEKAGDRYAAKGGWNCHQYHANSEFYADYGRYAVEITVPSRFLVGATGVMEDRREDAVARTTTYRFVQENVHDFAWTASPAFRRLERTFVADREVSSRELSETARRLGLKESEVRLSDVRMILLVQPEHAGQAERHFRALANAIRHYGLWYGRYPYQTITCVDPPYGAGGAGGMEYPTLITAGTSWIADRDESDPDMVVVHEFGHQYWYGMVGNNEFEESWLDEGINTYSTSRVLDTAYPPPLMPPSVLGLPERVLGLPVARLIGLPRTNWDALMRTGYLDSPKTDAVIENSWTYYDTPSYVVNSYYRPGLVLRTLEKYLGEEIMARVMRTYFEKWSFRHPTTRDFIAVASEVSKQDLAWFFDQFLYGSNVVDYKVSEVASEEVPVWKGLFDEPGGRATVTEAEAEKRTKQRNKDKGYQRVYDCIVKIQREGEAAFPVDVRIRFRNGETVDRHWDGEGRWVKYNFQRPAEIESVEIDPSHQVLLDVNFANNSYQACPQGVPLAKWIGNLLFWVQSLMLAVSSLS